MKVSNPEVPAPGDVAVEPSGYPMAVATNGRAVAVAYEGGRVALLSPADGAELVELTPGLGDKPWRLAFSPDGHTLAGLGHGGELRSWRMGEDATIGPAVGTKLEVGFERVDADWNFPFGAGLAWSPDGDRLLVFERGGQVSLWTARLELVARWTVETGNLEDSDVVWSRDGGQVFYAEGNAVVIRDGETGQLVGTSLGVTRIECPSAVATLAVHPTEDWLATGHPDSELMLWDLSTGKLMRAAHHRDGVFLKPESEVASIAWSPSGQRLAISTREGSTAYELDPVDLTQTWDSGFLGAHFYEALPVRWGPDSARLWFAFSCGVGGLFSVNPSPGAKAAGEQSGLVPVFANDFGVTLSNFQVRLVELDGTVRW